MHSSRRTEPQETINNSPAPVQALLAALTALYDHKPGLDLRAPNQAPGDGAIICPWSTGLGTKPWKVACRPGAWHRLDSSWCSGVFFMGLASSSQFPTWHGSPTVSYLGVLVNPESFPEQSFPGLALSHLEKGMATHSSILAWRIPWTEEPGELQSRGLQRVGHV